MKIALVAPHIFMQDHLLKRVIFSPGYLAIDLANELVRLGHDVTLCTPGAVSTKAKQVTANLSLLKKELSLRGDDELSLLKKHPLTFISLARQVQAELLAKVYQMANADQFDIVHIYMNEEELGLVYRNLCFKPVVFTHHDPFNFTTKYRSVMPNHTSANWISMSLAQRLSMPKTTNWVANIYHGLPLKRFKPVSQPSGDYLLYLGRIIEPKGVHLAIDAVRQYNQLHNARLKLKIAGKHYSGTKDTYWQKIEPTLQKENVEYLGFINDDRQKNQLLANAAALIIPSTFDEPFGMVMIEALAAGTPLIGLDSGAIPEVIKHQVTGFVVAKHETNNKLDQAVTVSRLVDTIASLPNIDRLSCRQDFEERFSLSRMAKDHAQAYRQLIAVRQKNNQP